MDWDLEDSVEFDGFDSVSLYSDPSKERLRMVVKAFSGKVTVTTRGTYIQIHLDEPNQLFFAWSEPPADRKPYKIYSE